MHTILATYVVKNHLKNYQRMKESFQAKFYLRLPREVRTLVAIVSQ